MKKELQSDWVEPISTALDRCEAEELALAYGAGNESSRRSSGSYYTPIDVARFFWRNYFAINRIVDADSARSFISKYAFLEPSAGSGMLFFSLLEALGRVGVKTTDMHGLVAHLVDINSHATSFIESQIAKLRDEFGKNFLTNVSVQHEDFLLWQPKVTRERGVMCFGNPPFVAQTGSWRNSAAEFMDRCLDLTEATGALSLIMPMSLCFSRDYRQLRGRIRSLDAAAFFANFDNIPDTLFKVGKPLSENTNKANSQRCTLATVISGGTRKLHTTRLMRWKSAEREDILSTKPNYVRADKYALDDQFPRTDSATLIRYLGHHLSRTSRLGDLLVEKGRYEIFVSGVARNYIGIRSKHGPGVLSLRTQTLDDYYRVLAVVTSRAFFDYWLSVGDGFHVTYGTVTGFPISVNVGEQVERGLSRTRRMWKMRSKFAKSKLNRGKVVESFDFTSCGLEIELSC